MARAYYESREEVPDWVPAEEVVTMTVGEQEVFGIKIDAVGDFGLVDPKGFKETIQKLRVEVNTANAEKKKYGPTITKLTEAGVELDVLLEAHRKVKDGVTTPADADKERQRALDKQREQFEAKTSHLEKQIAEFGAREERAYRKSVVAKALTHSGFNPDDHEFVAPVLEGVLNVYRREDGELGHRIVDESGQPKMSDRPGSSADMDAAEFAMDKMRNDPKYQRFVQGTKASGGGESNESVATTAAAVGGGVKVVSRDKPVSLEDIVSGKVVRGQL